MLVCLGSAGAGASTPLPRETPTPSASVVLTVTDQEPKATGLVTPSVLESLDFSGSGLNGRVVGIVGTHSTYLSSHLVQRWEWLGKNAHTKMQKVQNEPPPIDKQGPQVRGLPAQGKGALPVSLRCTELRE